MRQSSAASRSSDPRDDDDSPQLHSLARSLSHLQAAVMSERIVQLLQAMPLRDASPTVLIATALVALPVLAVLLNVAAQLVSRRVLVSAVTKRSTDMRLP